jgi:hypothetical protein
MTFRHTMGAGLLAATLLATVPAAALAQGTAPAPAPPAAGTTGPATGTQDQRQPSAAQAAQQERMRSCNAEAGTRNLTADARRSFMSSCLAGRAPSGSAVVPAPTSPAPPSAPR